MVTARPDPTSAESEVAAKDASRILVEALRRVAYWQEVLESFEVLPGSSLAGDDHATPYETISSQVTTDLHVAVDNMHTVKLAVIDGESLPAMAAFTLIRASIEAIGVGLWVLGPSSRDERVQRSLQLAAESRRDLVAANAEMSGTSTRTPTNDPVLRRLAEIQAQRPELTGRSLDAPRITKRLRDAQAYASDEPVSLVAVWRIASGITHGRRGMMYSILEREVVSIDDAGARLRMTSSFTAVAGFFVMCERHMARLYQLLQERNQPI